MSQLRRGFLFGLTAYVLWGVLPLYFKLLRPTGPMEILAHRVVWSAVFVAIVLTILRRWSFLSRLARQPGTLGGIALAAGLIGINWGTYIHGVNSDRVVEAALGYFINPLVSVLLGVSVLRERLRVAQWVAVGIGAGAVVVLAIDYGRPPYLALILALTFGAYGLVKKRLAMSPPEGLFVESAALALPAVGYLGWLIWHGQASFGSVSATHTVMMVSAGSATAIPLLLFAGAANRISLTGLGILQYVAPILQFGCGVLIFHEPMPPGRLAGFALVWLALIVFTVDGLRYARRRLAAAAPAPAVTAAPAAVDTVGSAHR